MSILVTTNAAIMTIEIDRPEKKNSINAAMYQRMADAIAQARADASVRVILIRGKQEIFTAGNDLGDFMNAPPSAVTSGSTSPVLQFLAQISQCEKPLVAAVAGAAVGIGTTMLFHCDLVFAADSTRFHMPFVSLGLVPEAASSYLLPQIVGYQRAAHLLMLGEPFDAAAGKEAGFVTQVVAADAVFATAEHAAAKLAALPPKSIRTTKALMKAGHAAHVAQQMATESGHFRTMLAEPAAREAFTAFFERRKPDFSTLR